MAGPGIDFGMSADADSVIRALDKVIAKQNQLLAGFQKTTTETKTVQTSTESLGERSGRQLEGLALRWLSVGAAVAAVNRAIQLGAENIKRIHEAEQSTSAAMIKGLALTGGVSGPDRRMMEQLGLDLVRGTGVAPQEAFGLFQTVRQAAPRLTSLQAAALTRGVAPAKQAGMELPEVGAAAAELSKIPGLFQAGPGKGLWEEQMANLAVYVTQAAGRRGQRLDTAGWGKLQQFATLGLDPREGLGLLLADLEGGRGIQGFTAMTGKLADIKEFPTQLGKRLSPADQLQRRFYAAGASERLAMLKTDDAIRDAVFGGEAPAVKAMLARGPEQLAAGAMAAGRGGYLATQRAEALADQRWAGSMAVTEAEAEAQRREYLSGRGEPAERTAFRKARLRQMGVSGAGQAVYGAFADVEMGLGGHGGGYGAAAGELDEAISQLRASATAAAEVNKNLQQTAENLARVTSRVPLAGAQSE